jgi:regulator of protease activity HflC (stomatin/prohibitin superfamily)
MADTLTTTFNWLLLGASIVLAIAVIYLLICLPFFLRWLADEDILLTTVQEGTAKAIMQGKNFHHFVMAYKGFHLNDPLNKKIHVEFKTVNDKDVPAQDWEVLPNDQPDKYYDNRPLILRWLGLYYVGIPGLSRSVYQYPFTWSEWTTREGKRYLWERPNIRTDFIYMKNFPYAIRMDDLKTADLLPVDIDAVLTTRTMNPYLALFRTEDWLFQVTAAAERVGRDFVGSHKFTELNDAFRQSEQGEYVKRNFSRPIMKLTNELLDHDDADHSPAGLSGKYGIAIEVADLLDVDLTGDAKALHEEETLKAYVAEQTAIATVTTATADAKAIKKRGRANADVKIMDGQAEATSLGARLKIIRENGSTGALLAQLDAMHTDKPGDKIIWANSPLPNVEKLLGAFSKAQAPKTTTDTATETETGGA